jgi:hypothetical protein
MLSMMLKSFLSFVKPDRFLMRIVGIVEKANTNLSEQQGSD